MKKPEHTRPFNLEHAKAGAPYCLRSGVEVTVLKWDARNPSFPLIGFFGPQDSSHCWTKEGAQVSGDVESPCDLVMLPLGEIDGKPVFVGDELRDRWNNTIRAFVGMGSNPAHWFWPAPARQYPVTGMDSDELREAWDSADNKGSIDTARVIANAALRHAIDNDHLFTKEDKDEAYNTGMNEGMRFCAEQAKARERKIAAAAYRAALEGRGITVTFENADYLDAIIAEVKP